MKMMHEKRVDTLFVVDDNDVLIGMLDAFLVKVKDNKFSRPIEDFVNRAYAIRVDTKVKSALYYIKELKYKNIPVIDSKGCLVGLVTRAAMVDYLYNNFWSDYEPEDSEVLLTEEYEVE